MELYMTTGTLAGHAGRVDYVGGRYPFRPVCSCGEAFWGYVAEHAAQTMLEAHLNGRDAAATHDRVKREPRRRRTEPETPEQLRMRTLQNYLAGRAGGTATEADVKRWQDELDALRETHGTERQQRDARVAAERAARAAEGPTSRFARTTPACCCATNQDGSVTTSLCPRHAAVDPCLTTSQVTGRRRRGTIRRGVCTACGHRSEG